MLHAISIT